jgi:hypothetical protein
MRAGAGDSDLTENDTGTRPASLVSPSVSANENLKEEKEQPFLPLNVKRVASELARPDRLPADLISVEEEGNPEFEVLLMFRQKIADLRRLPKHQKAQAHRAALEWLWSTMAALREKRAYARHRRRMVWQMKRMRPSGLD